METHWSERTFIKFHDVISPESCNKFDAASTFAHCLGKFKLINIILLSFTFFYFMFSFKFERTENSQ